MLLQDFLKDCDYTRIKVFGKSAGSLEQLFSGRVSDAADTLKEYSNCYTTNIITCGSSSALIYVDKKNVGLISPTIDQLTFI